MQTILGILTYLKNHGSKQQQKDNREAMVEFNARIQKVFAEIRQMYKDPQLEKFFNEFAASINEG
jgi:hypothetical protein